MDGLEHPTNDPYLPFLTDAIKTGQCVAIIGAGVSAADYPNWNGLIGELRTRCGLRAEDPSSTDPLDVAEAIKDRHRECYFHALDDLFQRKERPKSLYRYHLLARIPFNSYINLNFDPLLIDTLDLHRNVFVSDYPVLQSQHLDNRELFYIHGRLGSDRLAADTPIVLTRSDFTTAYDPDRSRLHALLQSTFLEHFVCFIGCDPSEPHLSHLLRVCETMCKHLHEMGDGRRPRWFMLWDDKSAPPSGLEHSGVRLMHYPKRDKSFSGLDNLLEYWAEKKRPNLRKPGVKKSPYGDEAEPER